MFDIVLQLLLNDQQRSDRSVSYAQFLTMPVGLAINQVYQQITKNLDESYMNDLTNASSICDGIYNQMGVELGL